MRKRALVVLCTVLVVLAGAVPSWGNPGVLQLASRAGFWGNDFPDKFILLQHWYSYSSTEAFTSSGSQVGVDKVDVDASFTRIVRPFHFGEEKQYQFIVEGIAPVYHISKQGPHPFSTTGFGDPLLYSSFGWNNQKKTTHLQGGVIVSFPAGARDVSLTKEGYGIMPLLGFEQRFSKIWLDASTGYWHNTGSRVQSGDHANDYYEFNSTVSYRMHRSWLYLQDDYTRRGQSRTAGVLNPDAGYNFLLAPGVGIALKPTITLDAKYDFDVAGKNTLKGRAPNVRLLWVF